ncbi:TAP42-like protein [Plectosphaerella plurivora]|uniref:TAP42-like protein n=1 Tax=Plectosphaerella plurivora TaxID=936078 RepID=A0A9P9AEX6_9PEZI|nr:TAP42-like protein [Plectosphaerella plurivora]
MADDDEPRTLRQMNERAELLRRAVESSSPPANPSYEDDVKAAIKAYRAVIDAVARVSLFSPNEGLEDISTSDLPFLLPNMRLAELHQKITTHNPHERKSILSDAREAYERFLGLLEGYDALGPPAHRTLYARYTDDPATFNTLGGAGADPARRRDAKIANFKAEKALKQRLETLRRNPRYALDEDGDGGGRGGGDEEIVRELYIAQLAYEAYQAFQGLEGINREIEVLDQADAMRPFFPHRDSSVEDDARRRRREGETDKDGYTERIEPRRLQSLLGQGGPILSREGRPLQPFTLVGSRQDVAAGVFRSGHNLPTMSVDEYLAEERRRGGIIEGGGEASYNRPEPDEDDYDKADADTYKARAWDEFTEANPKGAGNTLNRG